MATTSLDKRFPELQSQIREFQARYPKLSDDDSFLVWFVRAYLVDQDDQAANSVTGASKDKGIDAVIVDDNAHRVFVVQGKYRQKPLGKTEGRNDVLGFADLGSILLGDSNEFSEFVQDIDPLVGDKAKTARERYTKCGYKLDLYYVTTGNCSTALLTEARNRVRQATGGRAGFLLFDWRRVMGVLDDYLDGVAPPVPSVDLPLATGAGYGSGIVSQYDAKSGIESWVFTANGGDIGDLFKQGGVRIFARNVRGFLGSTEITRAMSTTLERAPEYFLYFNNGVTIVCDDAEKVESKGSSKLRIDNPQIINGQQTTRMLHAEEARAGKANVLVRVIRIPRGDTASGDRFENLVSQIVEATNWQNQIRTSDLMSNDRQQIILERELRKIGYQYLRKRQTKREARSAAGSQAQIMLKKEGVAQAVAACELDPVVVRSGKEGLFDVDNYKTVFPTGDANFYLSRYWLMRNVSSHAKGNPERTYAKWVIINFLWSDLGHELKKWSRLYRKVNESPKSYYPEVHRELDRLIERTVLAAVKFTGSNATQMGHLSIRRAFNSQGRGKQFAKFWASPQNPHRTIFGEARAEFLAELREVEA